MNTRDSNLNESGYKLTCLADIAPPTQQERTASEAGYRRGFMQGVAYAAKCIERGYSVDQVSEFACGAVADWRYTKHGGAFDPHPMIDC